ncbi:MULTISPECIES: N-6 DNA methylase [Haloarculaceae]|uniref:N-6 DNA methylase n=1 Tax=Natronomonadaceae TaxID=3402413 RepID=UPI0020C963E5|nr:MULTISPECIES: N-6 DNA methylase [Haloarculaceae]
MASIPDPSTYEPITEHLDEVHKKTGLRTYDIFTNWLNFIVTALSRNDDDYLELVHDLTDRLHDDDDLTRDVLETYGTALGALVNTMEETTVPGYPHSAELLGGIYEYYGANSDAFGQHFTSQNIAIAKAQMLFSTPEGIRDASQEDPITISDPACGSGRLPFHAVQQLRHISPNTPTVVVARDIDKTCAHMAVINFALHAIPAYVVHGNSLTYETWHVWRVNHPTRILTDSTVNGAITELDPDNAPIITSFEKADGSAQDDTNNDSDLSEGNVEDAVTIDDPDTIENVTLDAFSE